VDGRDSQEERDGGVQFWVFEGDLERIVRDAIDDL